MKRSILKKLLVLLAAVIVIGTFAVSCGGAASTPTRTREESIPLNDEDGITQADLNRIADFMLGNAEAYQGIVAAYRGYDILNDKVEDGTEEKFKQNENGETVRDVNVEAAKAVLAKYDTNVTLSYDALDAEDIINLVEALKYEVTYTAERGIMYGIGVVLGWITRYLGFGNYIVGICVFAIFLELVLLPIGISRQKNSIKQAKLRPKEMAIKNKYAGRNDQATMQKMQAEIQEMYQKEHFNPASGCLPLLIQIPIIMVLYSIVIDPLKHVLGISGNLSSAMQTFYTTHPLAGGLGGSLAKTGGVGSIEIISRVKEAGLSAFEGIESFAYFNNGTEVFEKLSGIYDSIPSFNIGNVNFGFTPKFTEFSWLLLVPVLTFVIYFASSKLTRKLMYQSVTTENQQMGCSNNMMDIMMPALSVYFTFQVPAVIGIYWMFKSILSTIQQFILVKAMPLPTFTEEDYKQAEREMAGKNKKHTSERAPRDPNAPKPRSLHHIDDEDYDEHGVYRPVDHSKDAENTAEKNATRTDAKLPEGAAPLKEDAPVREKNKKKVEKPAEETASENEESADEENK